MCWVFFCEQFYIHFLSKILICSMRNSNRIHHSHKKLTTKLHATRIFFSLNASTCTITCTCCRICSHQPLCLIACDNQWNSWRKWEKLSLLQIDTWKELKTESDLKMVLNFLREISKTCIFSNSSSNAMMCGI